jgi:hypothetical protein
MPKKKFKIQRANVKPFELCHLPFDLLVYAASLPVDAID